METPVSFAPLAARLAARAAEIRPADGARVDLGMIMALFVCALLEMLICLCEALDARPPLGHVPWRPQPRATPRRVPSRLRARDAKRRQVRSARHGWRWRQKSKR